MAVKSLWSSFKPYLTLAVATLGFAIFLSSVWTARNEMALVTDPALYTARFIKAFGCFAIAWFFRSYIPSTRAILGIGLGLLGAHELCYAASYLVGSGSTFPFDILSGALSGLAEACIILIYAHLFSTYVPKMSSIAIPVAYLLNEIFYWLSLYVSTNELIWLRGFGKIFGVALLVWCVWRKSHEALPDGEHLLQQGLSLRVYDRNPLRFLSSGSDWTLILVGTTAFPFFFGLAAQLCSSEATNSGLYDTTNELVTIAVIAALVVLGISMGERITFDLVLYISFPLFVIGFVALPYLMEARVPFSGTLIKEGYTVYQVLFWLLLARKCYEDIRHTYLYFGIFYGLFELMTAAARLLASSLVHSGLVDFSSITGISLVSLGIFALYGLVFFAVSAHCQKSEGWSLAKGRSYELLPPANRSLIRDVVREVLATLPAGANAATAIEVSTNETGKDFVARCSNDVVSEAEGTNVTLEAEESEAFENDEVAGYVDPFAARVERFCEAYGLSSREQEVLLELIHGYSMENIGKKLFVSRETVKTYLRRIYTKAGVNGKQQLISYIDDFE